jgi:ketopantoate hydroxymethyltransferase
MAKKFADAGAAIAGGLKQYVDEVTTKVFPEPERYFGIKEEEYVELRRLVEQEQG